MCFYPALPFIPGIFIGSLATWRQHSFIVSCFTVTLWDFLEFIPEDVRLFQEFPLSLANIVYEALRLSTFVWFMANLIHSHNSRVNMTYVYVIASVLQRGTTSMLFYLRVHALYISNRYIQAFFGAALVVVIVVATTLFEFSGVACGMFDVCIFIAILCKLGWQPPGREMGKSGGRRGFWSPFEPGRVDRIRGRFLVDSLVYVLLAIVIKIPQIILLVWTNHHWESLTWVACSVYVDIVVSSITASKVFRDMKLGLPGLAEATTSLNSEERFPSPPFEFATSAFTSSEESIVCWAKGVFDE
ncbi:hypothetical protein CPB83DRAFT_910460 [Crepidotus variabilis]|uniref:Uncharacterized protein n=1 Tax=Crepidotus variabilis TaxID=179855 RepID=A0A9P6JK01_9AGAR|nr:hypothetical protein CPB83DRAFT_910460 [Crepidotus variabilis]